MEDIKKVASCKVKPYELVERKILDSEKNQDNHVMLKDGLRVAESIGLVEEDLEDDVVDKDFENDVIGAKYLKMKKSISFEESIIYTVKLPVSEHINPEFIEAKIK